MKRYLYLTLLSLAALLVAGCAKESVQSVDSEGEAVYTFTLIQSGSASTKSSFSDGTTANYLMYGVYNSSGSIVDALSVTEQPEEETFTDGSLTTEVTIALAKGNSYTIAFWAVADGNPYDISFADGTISYDEETTLTSNVEAYDAFYAVYETGEVSGGQSVSVTLNRPFAQLNFGTDDLEEYYSAAETETLLTKVEVTGGYSGIDFLSGDAITSTETLSFDYATVPSGEEFPYSSTDYDYVSMNYLFTDSSSSTVDLVLYLSTDGDDENAQTVEVSAAPIQRNYRTNVYGSLLTGTYSITVTKDEEYDGSENIATTVSTESELAEALSNGDGYIVLAADIEAEAATTISNDVTIDLGGYTLSSSSSITLGEEGVEATITNGTIESSDYALKLSAEDVSLTLEDVEVSSEASYTVFITGSGASFEATGGSIASTSDAGRAICTTGEGVTIELNDVEVESPYIGIYTQGSGTTITAEDLEVEGCYYGIYTYGGTSTVDISDSSVEAILYAIWLLGSDNTLTMDGTEITSTEGGYADGITVGSTSGTTSGSTVTITNSTIDLTDGSYGTGVIIYGYNNDVTIESTTIKYGYYGIAQQGTSTPGSTYTVKDCTIEGTYTGIYLSMSTSSEYYNTMNVSGCDITSEEQCAIEVKKCYLTVSESTLTSKFDGTGSSYGDDGVQEYVLYGSGSGGSGYGIVLAGYTTGKSYLDDFDSTDGVISLSDITYTLGVSKAMDDSSDPWYVVIYNDDDSTDGVQTYMVSGDSLDKSLSIYSAEYTSNGATASSSFGSTTATTSSISPSAVSSKEFSARTSSEHTPDVKPVEAIEIQVL